MGRSPCCDKVGLKKGPWTPEEDHKLLAFIEEHGHGSWRALPAKAGLQRCGKSCRLRWTNYLRPDIKRGKFSLQEEQTIIQLHALLGNRWSAIATHLPKRTDNEIKNYWNTHLKKRLAKMGIDPVTHKPKNESILSSQGPTKTAANLSHMAQWESARLEAEARLVRQSKLVSNSLKSNCSSTSHDFPGKPLVPPPRCVDVFKAWNGNSVDHLDSPTSSISYSGNVAPVVAGAGEGSNGFIEFVGVAGFERECEEDWKGFGSSMNLPELKDGMENPSSFTSAINESVGDGCFMEKFTDLLLNNSGDHSYSDGACVGGGEGDSDSSGGGSEYYEENKNYWNNILNLVNSPPSDSPML